jgi:RNA polymerase sigma factor (TIGR02999 family)
MSGSESGPSAPEGLLAELYEELKALAALHLRGEREGHTLEPSALVHEAYLRLQGRPGLSISGRTHFRALASKTMRRVLVDHARKRNADKRAGPTHVRVGPDTGITEKRTEDVLALEAALEKLSLVDADAERIVEMRFYTGMTEVEIAEVLGVSDRWVRKQWAFARAWLKRELQSG